MVSRYLRPLAIVAMLCAGSRDQVVHAQTQPLRAMDHSMWTANDGAPQTITHLAQDPDGSLWIGGEGGLFNFDGITFRPFESPAEPKLPSGDVHSLLMTKAGTLWVAFNKAGLARVAAGRVTLSDTVDARPMGFVTQLQEAPDGSIWGIDSQQHLLRFGIDGTWRTEPVPTSASISGMFVDSANTLWLAQDGFLYRRTLPQTSYVRTNVQAEVITGFAETPNGDIWMNDYDARTSHGRTQQIDSTGRVSRTQAEGLPESGAIAATADGSLLVTSVAAGLRRMSSNELSLPPSARGNGTPDIITHALGLSSDATRAVLVDADGNIWIGGLRGLDRLRPVRIPRYLSEVKTDAWGLCATGGDLWAANAAGEVYSVSGPVTTRLQEGGDPLISLACADGGRAWFVNSRGVWSIDAGRIAALPPIAGARPRALIKIVAASDSTLYAMVTGALQDRGGVWRYRGGRWSRLQGDDQLPGGGYSTYVDRRDRLWIGHADGRAVLHSDNHAEVLPSGDPGLGYVHGFLDTSHGLFAVGTNGLAVLQDSSFKMLTYAEPSLVRGVRGMVDAANGDLWLNSANGFVHVAANELEAGIRNPTYPMKVRLVRDGNFGPAGGPHSVISYLDTAARDSQGQLWFATRSATQSDLVRFSPESNGPPGHAPKLTIRSIVADGRPLGNNRILRPTTRMVAIQYFGVNLTAPESVVYRYRLEGFDPSWLDAGRRSEAVYTNLPPGTYTFHVTASSSDGVWTTPLSSTPFTVLPHFYQTGWFATAIAALVALVVGIVHAARVRYISRQMHARFGERLVERMRIARELHDTLLQTVHGSKLVADRALRDTADRDRLVQALQQLSIWLGQAAAEGRAALQSMRASTTESNDLAGAFQRAANECRNSSSAEISLSVRGRARELHPAVRDEVYRIGFEAIRNACVHSGASRIEVTLEYGRDLRLRISDNGSGIDGTVVEAGKEGHFGLRGMRERAERIGAAFTLMSAPETGTAIALVVPGRLAFPPRGRGVATRDGADPRSSEYL